MGFEPTRAEHNGLAVHRLNLSATSSFAHRKMADCVTKSLSLTVALHLEYKVNLNETETKMYPHEAKRNGSPIR